MRRDYFPFEIARKVTISTPQVVETNTIVCTHRVLTLLRRGLPFLAGGAGRVGCVSFN